MKVFWAFTRQAFFNSSIYRFEFWLNIISILLISFFVTTILPLLWGIDLNTLPPEFANALGAGN